MTVSFMVQRDALVRELMGVREPTASLGNSDAGRSGDPAQVVAIDGVVHRRGEEQEGE
jgi:hypothetical protein